jgi:hypothetical protein
MRSGPAAERGPTPMMVHPAAREDQAGRISRRSTAKAAHRTGANLMPRVRNTGMCVLKHTIGNAKK